MSLLSPVCEEEEEATVVTVVWVTTLGELLNIDVILDNPLCAVLATEELRVDNVAAFDELSVVVALTLVIGDPVPLETLDIDVADVIVALLMLVLVNVDDTVADIVNVDIGELLVLETIFV